MSDMEALTVHVSELPEDQQTLHTQCVEGMDEYERSDYEFDNNLLYFNNRWWRKTVLETHDPSGFVLVNKPTPSEFEITAVYYNGGAHLDEVLISAMNRKI